MRRFILVLIVTLVSGCGLREVGNIETPYVASEYVPYAQPGSAAIVGTVAERQLAGRSMTCADMDVELMPSTTYTRESVAVFRTGKMPSGRASSDKKTLLQSVIKKAKCDASGHFAFSGLAAGTWIVGIEMRAGDGDSMTGAVFREIAVAPGETATLAFADTDFVPR